jgi:PAS domain S-box-containing protein
MQWSEEMYSIFGVKETKDAPGSDQFVSFVHPEDRERVGEYIESIVQGKFAEEIMYRIVSGDGKTKVIKTLSKADFDHKGAVVRAYGTCQDITREWQMNEKLVALNDSLSRKNKELELLNEELESFNYVASHDLQEPLRKIQIYGHRILEDGSQLSESGTSDLQKVLSAAERMQALITDLIEFSQVSASPDSFGVVDLNEVLEEVRSAAAEQLAETGLTLHVDHLPAVRAIPFQMNQLFTNLVNNAIKYRRTDVKPRVDIFSRMVTGPEIGKAPGTSFAEISVRDNGIGFEASHRERIFELFKRLHGRETYAGTGIGLSICRKIVTHHDGFIMAEGEPGKGATFRIYLPKERVVRE